ncbi:MAG: tRNA pseudouridine(54/55) synthase Pus10 [Methanomicrobiales archaeon]|nr:tRNA pseudouridine(54/55) synthase Pus10 [Methanomicrobiales archaeon]
MELAEQVERILQYGRICDHCLGRFFGKRSHGLSNADRGRALRIAREISLHLPHEEVEGGCWICQDLFREVDTWADRVARALEEIEYRTFLVGTRVPPLMAESEEMVWSDLGLTSPEPMKSEVNREVGKAVSGRTGKEVDFSHPDVVAILDLARGEVEVEITPVFFSGRYTKRERGIPQTRWYCRVCHGKGCERCHGTGKMYQTSVEELIAERVVPAFAARDAILHASGREDIDARMLGTGRPFVMEVVEPRTRTVPLDRLEGEINRAAEGRVGVTLTSWSDRHRVETIKSHKAYKTYRIAVEDKAYKTYRIAVEVDGAVSLDELQSALDRLRGAVIHQRTPQRVVHRRADRIRDRRVIDIDLLGPAGDGVSIEVVGEAGLYIKELISGDGGRTDPSLAGILGRPARVTSLDVVQVEEKGETGEDHAASSRSTEEDTQQAEEGTPPEGSAPRHDGDPEV